MKKWLLMGLAMVLAVSMLGVVGCGKRGIPGEEAGKVTLTDPNLEAAIREVIGKSEGSVHTSDVEGLTSLNASKRNITDLTGLEHCANLTELGLWGNQISDISLLASLTKLTGLDLRDNQISDIEPLVASKGLAEGDAVSLEYNPLSDASVNMHIPQLIERGVNVSW